MAFSSCCYCCSSVISSMIPSRVKDNLKSSAIVSWHGCSRIQLQHICYLQKTSLTCKRLIQMEGRLQCYYFSFKRTKMKSHHMNKELVDGLEEKLSDSFSGNWREDIFNNRLHQMLGLGEWFLQIYGLKLLSNYKNLIELQRSKKLFKMIGYISLIFSLTTLVLITSISTTRTKSLARALTEENQLFLEAWKTIDRAYIDKTFNGQAWFRYREDALRLEPMNTREETYAAIRRMLASLGDPFTRFLEPEKFKSLRSSTTGSLTGVGVELGLMDGDNNSADLVVISCIGGGPADHAGILPGDRITAVNGTSTKGIGLYDAAELLQGPENSVIKLTFQRGDSGLKDVILKREKITLDPVSWHICDFSKNGGISPRIGYIKLARFNQNASGAVRQAIEELRERKVTVYVLDLRNNSGGLFPEGVKIAKIWLDKGVIVYICDSKGVRDIYDTDGTEAIATSEPLIVLVNKGTASASEILAAALHDNKRAVLLGEKTYGKGKIQSVFELSDGSGMVVTVARYETPAHTDIDKVGVSPDYQLPEAFPVDGDDLCKCIQETNSACSIFTSTLLSNQSR